MAEVKQRSPEWFAERKERITGSNVGAILGLSPYRKPHDVMRAMVRDYHGAEREFTGNIATDYGTANEQTATIAYEMFHGGSVQECGFFVHPEYDWLGASPDGLVGDGGLLEIKCPFGQREKNPPEFKSLTEQEHYFAQCQIEMACAGRNWLHFYQWAPKGDKLERVEIDHNWLAWAIPKLRAFYDSYLVEREAPKRHLAPRHEVDQRPALLDIATQYKEINDTIKELEVRKKDLLADILDMADGAELAINDMKLSQVERKGNVNYKAIPELDGVDLEQYRGKSSKYWTLK